jgi:hypothetical protein
VVPGEEVGLAVLGEGVGLVVPGDGVGLVVPGEGVGLAVFAVVTVRGWLACATSTNVSRTTTTAQTPATIIQKGVQKSSDR